VDNAGDTKESNMARRKTANHSAEDNAQRIAALIDEATEQRRARSIAAKERAIDLLEQSNLRARWLAAKARALELLADTDPRIKHARELRAKAEAILKRTAHFSMVSKRLAEEERWIAAESARQRRERRKL
jgi:hypothetical protein